MCVDICVCVRRGREEEAESGLGCEILEWWERRLLETGGGEWGGRLR